ncbi:MAG: MBL fold metallo-hydrolase [Spirochaetaceae bacterium]|nr:MAG: MBL fold metallo-hydrolase [Spirochaetaceae bacterium]
MMRNRRVATLLILLLLALAPLAAESMRVHFIDVGQGEAVLLETGEAAILVDAGNGSTVAEYLVQEGIRRIDLAVATHAHADHVGGFPAVFDRLPVKRVWYNGQVHTTRTFERFLDAILGSDAIYEEPGRGDQLAVGSMTVTVLHPPGSAADYRGHLHDMNIVVRIEQGAFSVLVTGDAETFAERSILEWVRSGALPPESLRSSVLQLGHHGSYTSSGAPFLSAVSPRIVVYQAGRDNRYGHPHGAVIRRVRETTGADILGTDKHGTIVITAEGNRLVIRTALPADPGGQSR